MKGGAASPAIEGATAHKRMVVGAWHLGHMEEARVLAVQTTPSLTAAQEAEAGARTVVDPRTEEVAAVRAPTRSQKATAGTPRSAGRPSTRDDTLNEVPESIARALERETGATPETAHPVAMREPTPRPGQPRAGKQTELGNPRDREVAPAGEVGRAPGADRHLVRIHISALFARQRQSKSPIQRKYLCYTHSR